MLLLAFQPFLHALSVSLLCIFFKNKKGFQHEVHQIWIVVPWIRPDVHSTAVLP